MATLLISLVAGETRAQNHPPVREIAPQGADGATSVREADLDGDGDHDVISVSSRDDKIAWYENTESGFSDQKVLNVPDFSPINDETNGNVDSPMTVHAADLDGDGDPDILSAAFSYNGLSSENKIVWFENTESGFSSQNVITTDARKVTSVYAGDLDGDSDPDVLSASRLDGIAWYENTESGFSNQNTITTDEDKASHIRTADLDGDGDPDVLYTTGEFDSGKIAWRENTESGFSNQNIITTDASGPPSVHATDLDGDSDLDVLSGLSDEGKIVWHENTGSGFSDQQVIATDANGVGSVYTADLDGDGDPDVLSALNDDDKITAYENQIEGEGGFSPELEISASADRARSVHAGDLDGDSDPDVLSAHDDKIAWYENSLSSGEGFGSERLIAPVAPIDHVEDIHVADLNGDGDPDVISASPIDDKIAWYENVSGSFLDQKVIDGTNGDVDGPNSVHVADLDGDSDLDLLSASEDDDKIVWFENTEDGFSGQNIITTEAYGPQSVHAADLDGDGDADVLSGSGLNAGIDWYENTPDGFSNQQVITTDTDVLSIYAADLDEDGDQDILSTSSAFTGDKIVWFENIESGFSEQNVITDDVMNPRSVHAADLDGDSDPDVLSASRSDDKVAWYENTEDGFSDQEVITTDVSRARSVYAADLNGDDKLDVLSASLGEVSWYEQKTSFGSISFTKEAVSSVIGGYSVRAADIDGDSDLDILSGGGLNINWYENTSSTLPVEFASIRAIYSNRDGPSGGTVRLSWQTASETNNAGFRVQRQSVDGKGWKTVGNVEGSGTTSRPQSYRFADTGLPYADRLTYRLKQVDTDGSASYSKVATVERDVQEAQVLDTYPNPASEKATLRYAVPERQNVTIHLYDILGRRVQTVVDGERKGRHKQALDVSGLANGVYFLRLRIGDQIRTRKLTIVQ